MFYSFFRVYFETGIKGKTEKNVELQLILVVIGWIYNLMLLPNTG